MKKIILLITIALLFISCVAIKPNLKTPKIHTTKSGECYYYEIVPIFHPKIFR